MGEACMAAKNETVRIESRDPAAISILIVPNVTNEAGVLL